MSEEEEKKKITLIGFGKERRKKIVRIECCERIRNNHAWDGGMTFSNCNRFHGLCDFDLARY